ncbi:MAG: hypothetical protein HFH10_05970 [Dorea sp.]|nr:hypothetical protein [Dorea sp.]
MSEEKNFGIMRTRRKGNKKTYEYPTDRDTEYSVAITDGDLRIDLEPVAESIRELGT